MNSNIKNLRIRLQNTSLPKLKVLAKELGIANVSDPNKSELIDLILSYDEKQVLSLLGSESPYSPSQWEKIVAFVAAVFIVGLVSFLLIRNAKFADPNYVVMIRLMLSFAVACLGASVPGFLSIDLSRNGLLFRAGGALALFVITFFFTPTVLPNLTPLEDHVSELRDVVQQLEQNILNRDSDALDDLASIIANPPTFTERSKKLAELIKADAPPYARALKAIVDGNLDMAKQLLKQDRANLEEKLRRNQDATGKVYAIEGKLDEAASWYEKSLKLFPDNYFTRFNLAAIYGKNKDYQKLLNTNKCWPFFLKKKRKQGLLSTGLVSFRF